MTCVLGGQSNADGYGRLGKRCGPSHDLTGNAVVRSTAAPAIDNLSMASESSLLVRPGDMLDSLVPQHV
ncbi:hypothetical protein EHYA_09580 [Embleya hyalina]|uniref:Uncharacterized protein n=1 Tax=Embleya hyalina TaxID=516124 RepID=A0A401Z4Q7_9ACTN|nr:hypothetical protein EHYA_09580 [Embleya hyalina]